MRVLIPVIVAAIAATSASAEVKSIADNGFEVSHTRIVRASPQQVYTALGRIGQWWSSAHTYSGDARNMSIRLEAGECFCESVPKDKASIEHGRVIYAHPDRLLRVQGGLGPIQAEGATGVLTWTLKQREGGTEITQSYVVGGYIRGGAKAYASAVDGVMSEQLEALGKYVERR
jgi:uncharacterized protein YndB with AHSA1/START domain